MRLVSSGRTHISVHRAKQVASASDNQHLHGCRFQIDRLVAELFQQLHTKTQKGDMERLQRWLVLHRPASRDHLRHLAR